MTDGASGVDAMVGLMEALTGAEERDMTPLIDNPDGQALYEVVLAGEQPPEAVKKYVGRDVIERTVYVIRGGDILPDGQSIQAYLGPSDGFEEQHARFVCATSDLVGEATAGYVNDWEFTEVPADD